MRLGNRRNGKEAAAIGRAVQVIEADRFAARILPIIEGIKRSGATSLSAIADALNARGVRSARGGHWHISSIQNLLARAESNSALLLWAGICRAGSDRALVTDPASAARPRRLESPLVLAVRSVARSLLPGGTEAPIKYFL